MTLILTLLAILSTIHAFCAWMTAREDERFLADNPDFHAREELEQHQARCLRRCDRALLFATLATIGATISCCL
jgi:hypothetical protein